MREGLTGMTDCCIHPTCVVDDHVTIGSGTRIWHFSHIQSGAVIGSDCSFGQNVYIASRVRIGNGVRIQNNVSVYEGVELEDHVFCGPSCVFTNVLTPRSRYPRGSAAYARTLVKEGASIGANATVLCGHTIGRHALIAAGAVVTCDVGDHALMSGIPRGGPGGSVNAAPSCPILCAVPNAAGSTSLPGPDSRRSSHEIQKPEPPVPDTETRH